MNDNFSYHITRYFSDYLPNQTAASTNTIHSYRDTFVQFMNFYKTVYKISPEKLVYKDFTTQRLEAFLTYLETERNISISTRNQRLAAIHAFFRYIQYRDPSGFEQCADVLSVPFKKAPVASMTYMNLEETGLLFSLPEQQDKWQLRDLSILVLMYESGARVQELIDLCPAHLRFASITIVELHGKGNKTRHVPINADAASIIKKYIKVHERNSADHPLFVNHRGEKLTRAGIQYIIDKYVLIARQNRPDLFKTHITSHCFRHSKAMHLLEAGVNLIYIRDFLGHSSVVTTEIYAKTSQKIKEEHLMKYSSSIEIPEKYNRKQKDDLIDWLKKNL